MSQITYTRNRVICVKPVPPVKKIHLETGSSQSGKRCYGAGLVKGSGACFLPFSIIPRVLEKVQIFQVKTMVLIAPTL